MYIFMINKQKPQYNDEVRVSLLKYNVDVKM